MRSLIIAVLLYAFSEIHAQSSFRIYDAQMNDVSSGFVFVTDTNASQMQINLIVENADSITHTVTAGRTLVPPTVSASNAFIWNQLQYAPGADTSVPEVMNSGTTLPFVGYYFPNNVFGMVMIEYCFWETTDMNNKSCVTVSYDHYITGTGAPINPPSITAGPNPAQEFIGFGWSHGTMSVINIYSSTGQLVATRNLEENSSTEFEISDWTSGIYFYQITDSDGFTMTGTFVH